MRVIAGSARGVPLRVPKGEVRPTTDRVREAAFSMLGGMVRGARCLDLFAGSGALGIEALSRGSESCVFVDASSAAIATVRVNLEKARVAGATLRQADVFDYLRGARSEFDLVFADPPYGEAGRGSLATELAASPDMVNCMGEGAVLVLESRSGAGDCPAHERLELLQHRQYGESQLEFFRRAHD